MSNDVAADISFDDSEFNNTLQTFTAVVHPLVLFPVELNSTLALPTDSGFDYNNV